MEPQQSSSKRLFSPSEILSALDTSFTLSPPKGERGVKTYELLLSGSRPVVKFENLISFGAVGAQSSARFESDRIAFIDADSASNHDLANVITRIEEVLDRLTKNKLPAMTQTVKPLGAGPKIVRVMMPFQKQGGKLVPRSVCKCLIKVPSGAPTTNFLTYGTFGEIFPDCTKLSIVLDLGDYLEHRFGRGVRAVIAVCRIIGIAEEVKEKRTESLMASAELVQAAKDFESAL